MYCGLWVNSQENGGPAQELGAQPPDQGLKPPLWAIETESDDGVWEQRWSERLTPIHAPAIHAAHVAWSLTRIFSTRPARHQNTVATKWHSIRYIGISEHFLSIFAAVRLLAYHMSSPRLEPNTGMRCYRRSSSYIHGDPKNRPPLTLCRIALSFHNVFSQKSTKCLRKLGAVNSTLIHVPPAAGVRTWLFNVDVNRITLQRTMHVIQHTVKMLKKEAPDFIPHATVWPPNSPDLNPVDNKIWSVMWMKVYKHHVKDISELRERIVAAWDELSISASLIPQ